MPPWIVFNFKIILKRKRFFIDMNKFFAYKTQVENTKHKVTVMQIGKSLINDPIRNSKVS